MNQNHTIKSTLTNQYNSFLLVPFPIVPGVPTMFVWAFKLCRPFMDKESYDNMLIRSDLKGNNIVHYFCVNRSVYMTSAQS